MFQVGGRTVSFCLGFNLILEMPMTRKDRQVLIRKMRLANAGVLSLQLLASSESNTTKRQDYKLVYYKLAPYLSWFAMLRFRLLGLMFIFPAIGALVALTAVRISNNLGFTSLPISEFGNR